MTDETPPRVKGKIESNQMDGGVKVALEVRGDPGDELEDVLDAWDDRFENMMEEAGG